MNPDNTKPQVKGTKTFFSSSPTGLRGMVLPSLPLIPAMLTLGLRLDDKDRFQSDIYSELEISLLLQANLSKCAGPSER